MKWRNEQIYHLRQTKPLTTENQDSYFENVVAKLFDQKEPNHILFSFLEEGVCIGYGGLVHINWIEKKAEISFIMDTALEKGRFQEIWLSYLKFIEEVAFNDLSFYKIYTYAYDLRPHLYEIFENSGFIMEGRIKEHYFFNGEFKDVLIHVKLNKILNKKQTDEENYCYNRSK